MDYYVYLHRKKTNGEVFYVGKGCNRRAYDTKDRSEHWKRTSKKYGFTVEIISNGLQDWYAKELESDYIAYYGRNDLDYGKLVNFTDGGDGISGLVHSEETKDKLRRANLGKKATEEARAKMSNASIGKPKSIEMRRKLSETNKGHYVSEEVKTRLRDAHTGKKMSEEFCKAVSERLKGNTHLLGHRHSDETKAMMSNANKGRVWKYESKQKMTEYARVKSSCPVCNFEGNPGNLAVHIKKYHQEK